jgi:O-antigen ligase
LLCAKEIVISGVAKGYKLPTIFFVHAILFGAVATILSTQQDLLSGWLLILIAPIVILLGFRGLRKLALLWVVLAPLDIGANMGYLRITLTQFVSIPIILWFILDSQNRLLMPHIWRWGLLVSVFAVSAIASVILSPLPTPSIAPTFRLLLLTATSFCIIGIFNKRDDYHLLMVAMSCQIVIWYVSYGLNYLLSASSPGISLQPLDEGGRLAAANILAFVMALSLPFVYFLPFFINKISRTLFFIWNAILLVLTFSRMGFIWAALDGLYLAWSLGKIRGSPLFKFATILVVVAIIPIFLFVNEVYVEPGRDLSNIERMAAIRSSFEAFLEYPLTGVGYGQWIRLHELNIGDKVSNFYEDNYQEKMVTRNPHNGYLRIVVDTGGMGIFLFLVLLAYTVRRVFRWCEYRGIEEVIAHMCLKIATMNLLVCSLFGDYTETTQFWAILVVGVVWETHRKLAAVGSKYPRADHVALFPNSTLELKR